MHRDDKCFSDVRLHIENQNSFEEFKKESFRFETTESQSAECGPEANELISDNLKHPEIADVMRKLAGLQGVGTGEESESAEELLAQKKIERFKVGVHKEHQLQFSVKIYCPK